MEQNIVEIDGSELEGGGQILRMAVAFSTILGVPIHVTNIRGGRAKGGLKAQHLTGLQLVRDISQGSLTGGKIDSMEITYKPGQIKGGDLCADTQTAGSVCLLMQSTLPCALFGTRPVTLTLRGGTNADMAPPIDYYLEVFRTLATKFGVTFDVDLRKRGFFPQGGGEVVCRVSPLSQPIQPIEMLDPGDVIKIGGVSYVAGVLPIKLAHVAADVAEKQLRQRLRHGVEVIIQRIKEPPQRAHGTGSGIFLWAETSTGCIFGSSALGRRGVQAETVGEMAGKELLAAIDSGACLDKHAQDQVIIFMALAKGKSRIRISSLTLHTKTAMHVASLMTDAVFETKESDDKKTLILECTGIGHGF